MNVLHFLTYLLPQCTLSTSPLWPSGVALSLLILWIRYPLDILLTVSDIDYSATFASLWCHYLLFHTISKAVFNNHFFVAYTASWYEILWYPHQTEVFRCFKFFSVVVAVFFSRVIYRYWVELDAFEVFFEIKGLFRFARPAKIWLPIICWYI